MAARELVKRLRPASAMPLSTALRTASRRSYVQISRPSRPLQAVSAVVGNGVRSASTISALDEQKKTPLYDTHVAHGARMVPFGGYLMPVQYKDLSISESHIWTREKASIFDVSHMVQHHLSGPGAEGLLAKLTPSSVASLPEWSGSLSCLLHEKTGGIVDDCIITRLGPQLFYFVTNAGCREKDLAFLAESIDKWNKDGNPAVEWKVLEGQGLVAVQGPLAAQLLEPLIAETTDADLKSLLFGQCRYITFRKQSGGQTSALLVSRGGYTGEDGFEISVPAEETAEFVDFLLTTSGQDNLRFAGLGARDSLRLEAGMCLYGHDLDDTTTPPEAGLSWVIGKDRRTPESGFNGAETILPQLKSVKNGGTGVKRRRVGFVVQGAPAREGASIVNADGEEVGTITSGCPSPTLGKNIAMGYVQTGNHEAGKELTVLVRGKPRKATVTKMPFVPSNYWKGGKA